jgi:hypothetical protein
MTRFNRNTIHTFKQERLAKDDIRLLLEVLQYADLAMINVSQTRMELLIGKLKRMEKA